MDTIDTTKLESTLKEIREKIKSVAQDNGLDLSKGDIIGRVNFYGDWGDYTIDTFAFDITKCLDREGEFEKIRESYKALKELARPIERGCDTIIGDFVEKILEFDWDENVDFSHWYQDNGGEGSVTFYLGDDKIEIDAELSFREVVCHTQYAHEVGFYDDFWTDKQKECLITLDNLGLDHIIRAEFSGSGDSGGYDGSYVYDDIQCTKCLSLDVQRSVLEVVGDDIQEIGYAIMDCSSVDWYNNEGGGGYILIDLANKKVHIDVWQNFDEYNPVWADKIVFKN